MNLKINGLHDVLNNQDDILEINNVIFSYDGETYSASTKVEAVHGIEALTFAQGVVSIALSKIIFAYNTEAFIDEKVYNYIDFDSHSKIQTDITSLKIRFNHVQEIHRK